MKEQAAKAITKLLRDTEAAAGFFPVTSPRGVLPHGPAAVETFSAADAKNS
jgi:hypothetical protein